MTELSGAADSASPPRAPNIRDVAKAAGVSHQTVSRVLNDHPSIREATKERVLQVMEQLQYRPNRAARTLVTSKSRTIGILAATSASHYGPASSIGAIQDAAREAGYYVSTANMHNTETSGIQDALNHLVSQSVEGIVVIAPQKRVFDVISELQVSVPYVTMQSSSDSPHTVSVDQRGGARLATRHLIERGHRMIYHLAGPQDWIEAEERMAGFLEEMSAQDIPTTAPILGDWSADFGYRAGRELLRFRDFTAIFSSNDQMALGLIHAIRDAGLDCPRDVSIVGFDDIPEAAHFWPPLTTVRQDFTELGRRCVAQLLGNISEPEVVNIEGITAELVVRGSTAGPSF